MLWHLNLITFLSLIFQIMALDYSIPPIAHSDCPAIDDDNHAVMLPFPQDCSKYYSCLKGQAYLRECPNNLHWSTITYRCDYPNVAKCQTMKLPISAEKRIVSTPKTLTASLTGETVYQLHPHDCSKYYRCEILSCPINYYWNSFTEKCDFPHNTRCPFLATAAHNTGLTTSQSLQSLVLENIWQLGRVFAFYYPNDCNKFFKCQLMECPHNYHWNTRTQQCDLPQRAQCIWQPQLPVEMENSSAAIPTARTPPPTPSATIPPNANSTANCSDCVQRCDGSLHHYLPHPFDCHKFIQCNGWSFIHTCPDNLFWNAKLNICDRICVIN